MSQTGVSRRAFAKGRGISEASVRKHIAEGTLADALLPDGTLDPNKADRLLAKTVTRGAAVPVVLATAKARRLRAVVRQQGDELAVLHRTLIPPYHAERLLAVEREMLAGKFRKLVDVATTVAGQPGNIARLTLRDAVNGVLTDIFNTVSQRVVPGPGHTGELNLDGLPPVALAALQANQQAEKLEIERALAKGHLRPIVDYIGESAEANAIAKSLLLAIPGRTATQLEFATIDEARAIIAAEVELVVAVLR